MIKLAFFVIFPKPIDFRMVLVGNPGIGGAEFCFALLIMKMNELFSSEIEITVFQIINMRFLTILDRNR